jgi:hypothetical protein
MYPDVLESDSQSTSETSLRLSHPFTDDYLSIHSIQHDRSIFFNFHILLMPTEQVFKPQANIRS